MKKVSETKHNGWRKYIIVLLAVLVLFAFLYLIRGWLRNDLIPGLYAYRHAKNLQVTLDNQAALYNQLLAPTDLHLKKEHAVACGMSSASWFFIRLWCGGSMSGNTIYGQPDEKITEEILSAEAKLKKQGWQGGVNHQWGDGPDADVGYIYDKKFGDSRCHYLLFHAPARNSLRSGLHCGLTDALLDKLRAPGEMPLR